MKIVVPQFPGTNCEFDTKYAFEHLGHEVQVVWHEDETVRADTDLIVIPGGFSYGDYLRSGAIARFSPIMKAIKAYADNGGYVLGICNGFQILLESHLLPGAMKRNENLHFVSKHQYLKVENSDNRFLRKCKTGDILNIPIAHAEGNFFIEKEGLAELYENGQVLLTYCDQNGNPDNPNGSVDNIAGICNKERNVFGLMPHPERAIEAILGSDDGIKMLEGFIS